MVAALRTTHSQATAADHGHIVAFGGNRQAGSIDVATACNAHGGTGRHDFESETFLVAPPLTGKPYGDHESREGLLTISPTLSHSPYDGRNLECQSFVNSRNLVRRLTPTESLRLQGFPDDWLDLDPPLSDSAKYRMVGNAVTVNVIKWIRNRFDLLNG